MSAKDIATTMLMTLLVISCAVVVVGSVSSLGMTFTREKKSRALEMLLTTDLSDREIIGGKVAAAFLSLLPWAIGAAALGLGLLVMYGGEPFLWDIDAWGIILMVLVEILVMWFGYACLALWISLRHKKNVALGICILVWMGWNTFGRGLIMAVTFGVVGMGSRGMAFLIPVLVVGADVLFHGTLGAVCLASVFSSFRRVALQDQG